MTFLKSDSVGLNVVTPVSDQLVKWYFMCEKNIDISRCIQMNKINLQK